MTPEREALRVARDALVPFAETASWAENNGHDLRYFDMIMRGPNKKITGRLHAQSKDFIRALEALAAIDRALDPGRPVPPHGSGP